LAVFGLGGFFGVLVDAVGADAVQEVAGPFDRVTQGFVVEWIGQDLGEVGGDELGEVEGRLVVVGPAVPFDGDGCFGLTILPP
jgi:hypothetical protein